jgi:hypothetical protein
VDAVVVELVGVLIEPSDTPGELLRVGLIRHVGILADHAGRCPFRANDRSGPRGTEAEEPSGAQVSVLGNCLWPGAL